jgi:hypothetical protein
MAIYHYITLSNHIFFFEQTGDSASFKSHLSYVLLVLLSVTY